MAELEHRQLAVCKTLARSELSQNACQQYADDASLETACPNLKKLKAPTSRHTVEEASSLARARRLPCPCEDCEDKKSLRESRASTIASGRPRAARARAAPLATGLGSHPLYGTIRTQLAPEKHPTAP